MKRLAKGNTIEYLNGVLAPKGTLMTVTRVDDEGIDVLDRGEVNSFFTDTVAGSFRLAAPAPVEANGSDEIDLYDHNVQAGIAWTMRQWGETLGLTTWVQGDGSESVESDVGAEIHTILIDAGLRDPETNEMAALRAQPSGETREQLAAIMQRNIITNEDGGFSFHDLKAADEILSLIRPAPVGGGRNSGPTGNRIADALTAGFLHGVGRQPWDDMHDYIAVCAVGYVNGEALPTTPPSDPRLDRAIEALEGGLPLLETLHSTATSTTTRAVVWREIRRTRQALASIRGEA